MNPIRRFLRLAYRGFPLSLVMRGHHFPPLLPFYHTVSDRFLPHIVHLYKPVSIAHFENDLDFFLAHFKAVSMEELTAMAEKNIRPNSPIFHLTFDDGLSQCNDIISPILIKKGIPATFFVNTGFVDNEGLFYRYKISLILESIKNDNVKSNTISAILKVKAPYIWGILDKMTYHDTAMIDELGKAIDLDFRQWTKEHKPYMTWDQISHLSKKGFTIGGHSVDHPWFKHINVQEQKYQVSSCMKVLQEKLGTRPRCFSFPFSDENVSKAMIGWMYREEKIKMIFGISGIKHESIQNHLHRIPMEEEEFSARQILSAEYAYYWLKAPFGKNKIQRR